MSPLLRGGLMGSKKEDRALVLSRLVQATLNGRFVDQLKTEWEELKQKGKIKDGFVESEQGQVCLKELLEFLDNDKPDQKRFDFVKRLYLAAATDSTMPLDSVLPHEYLRIGRTLNSGEVILLQAIHKATKDRLFPRGGGAEACTIEMIGTMEWLRPAYSVMPR